MTIGSGQTEGAVHQFLLSLAKDSARSELDIQPEMATGTIDLLDQVHSGELDFAIVHGGFDMDHYHNIRQIGVLSVAPVHLLVKKEHHTAVLDDLQNLRGRTISLGSGKHTVMYLLSQEVLSFVGLAPKDYQPLVIPFEELVRENDPSRLPDVVFISTMPPSEVVRRLVVDFGYRLVPLPFGDAFRLTALHLEPLSPVVEGIRKENIVDATIPAYAYKASPPVPPQAIPTLGLRVLLVANSQTDRRTVAKVIDLMIASRFAEAMQPSLDAGMVRAARGGALASRCAGLPSSRRAADHRRGNRRALQCTANPATGRRNGPAVLGMAPQPRAAPPRARVRSVHRPGQRRRETRARAGAKWKSGPSGHPAASPRALHDQGRGPRAHRHRRGERCLAGVEPLLAHRRCPHFPRPPRTNLEHAAATRGVTGSVYSFIPNA